MRIRRHLLLILLLASLTGLGTFEFAGQTTSSQAGAQNPEFKLRVERNLVPVRVIVRDSQGRPVRNLTKDDFRVLDNGKPQIITQFSTEGENATAYAPTPAPSLPGIQATPKNPPSVADRFVALYFDDMTMKFDEIVRTRDAAERYLKSSMNPNDRVGLFTSSGQGNLDFTADRDKLHDALFHLQPRSITNRGTECPDLSQYEAYLITEQHDVNATQIATAKVIQCQCGGNAAICPDPQDFAESAALSDWHEAENQLLYSLRELEQLVNRLAIMPGQRSIVFISPGFLDTTQLQMVNDTIDRAVRAGVVVNTLDSRGLWADVPGGDATRPTTLGDPALMGQLTEIQLTGDEVQSDVLAEVADGTGGLFFHNNNDFDAGFREVGALSQFSYLLTFSPETLMLNGKFHRIKIQVVGSARASGLSVQARRGYFAPKGASSADAEVKQELQDAAFSRDEINGLPVEVETSFSTTSPVESHLVVLTRLDPKSLHFLKQDNRNLDDISFLTIVFDSNGNYVNGTEKTVELRLLDATLHKLLATGMAIRTSFKVSPGTYLVREVVRDSSGLMTSLNQTVDIPF